MSDPLFLLQLVDTQTGEVVRIPPGTTLEADFLASCADAILASGVTALQGAVGVAIPALEEGLQEILDDCVREMAHKVQQHLGHGPVRAGLRESLRRVLLTQLPVSGDVRDQLIAALQQAVSDLATLARQLQLQVPTDADRTARIAAAVEDVCRQGVGVFASEAHVRQVTTEVVSGLVQAAAAHAAAAQQQVQAITRRLADHEAQVIPTIRSTHAMLTAALEDCVNAVLSEARTAVTAQATVRQGLREALSNVLLRALPIQVRIGASHDASVEMRRLILAGLQTAIHALKTQTRHVV